MELTRDNWKQSDVAEFQDYLRSFAFVEKKEWCTNILKTSLPVLVINNNKMKEIMDNIAAGNFLEFLDLWIWEYYENAAINGFLITKIISTYHDYDLWKNYLDIYANKIDCWANCDLLKFPLQGNEEKLLALSREYCKSEKPFVRRIGLYINFCYIDDYINEVFKTLDMFTCDDNYYIVMMGGWLLSECIIKKRDETLAYLLQSKAYYKIINKGIQKCRESYRVSKEDKEMLLQFKIKPSRSKK